MNPRIYTYKITFEEVPYYYYGIHKEKRFGEYYMGSPVTHKWAWDFYTPKKQILELFDYSDEGWSRAVEIESRLIKPFYNTDKWCLNENCGNSLSLSARSKNGKKGSQKNREQGTAIFGLTTEQKRQIGLDTYERKVGIHSLSPSSSERSERGKKGAATLKERKIGIFALTTEQLSENGKRGGLKAVQEKIGVHSLTPAQLSEYSKMGAKKGAEILNRQRWQCLETGYVSTAGGLSQYQIKRGIDTSKRKRIE
jgi:hypothetical protein